MKKEKTHKKGEMVKKGRNRASHDTSIIWRSILLLSFSFLDISSVSPLLAKLVQNERAHHYSAWKQRPRKKKENLERADDGFYSYRKGGKRRRMKMPPFLSGWAMRREEGRMRDMMDKQPKVGTQSSSPATSIYARRARDQWVRRK